MSRRRKPRRRDQGHPERIAARRERDRSRTSSPSPVQPICRAAARTESALDAEIMTSDVLGILWEQFAAVDPFEPESEAEIALIEDCAAHGGKGALIILRAFAAVASPEARGRAKELAAGIEGPVEAPDWIDAIGTARTERIATITDPVFDDGKIWLLESVNRRGDRDTISFFVNNNLGCSLDDIVLSPPIEEAERLIEREREQGDESILEEVDPALAAARLRAAMELTDDTFDPDDESEYAATRAIARARIDALPEAEPDDGRPKVSETERKALRDEFLSSPEAVESDLSANSDASMLVEAAINFSADFADGRPLRWSPDLVEIFATAWLPEKVIADEDFFNAVPAALDTWVRFTARKRGLSSEALEMLVIAVDVSANNLGSEDRRNPEHRSPGDELFEAIQEAGIDVTDQQALESFIAGWNARSDLS